MFFFIVLAPGAMMLGYSYYISNRLLCQWTLARTHVVAETSKSVSVLKRIQSKTCQLISCLAFMLKNMPL